MTEPDPTPDPTPDQQPAPEAASDGPSRRVIIAAVAGAVAAVVAVLACAATTAAAPVPGPVAIAAAPAPQADSDGCKALMKDLPDDLDDYHRAEAMAPAPASAAAWQNEPGSDLVVLRCGIGRPDDFSASAPLQAVDDVLWFRIPGVDRTTWVAVDRPVYVALTLPEGSGPTPIQLLSRAVAKAMPAVVPDPGPVR